MSEILTAGEQNLILLESLLPADEKFYLWCFTAELKCIGTSCPEDETDTLLYFFEQTGGQEKLRNFISDASNAHPLLIGSSLGMQWAAVRHQHRTETFAVLIGPVFYALPDEKTMYNAVFEVNDKIKKGEYITRFMQLCRYLPVISYAIFSRYILMVHNMLNEEKLSVSDITASVSDSSVSAEPAGIRNRTEVYNAEKALLGMVRSGDINYQEALQNSVNISAGVQVSGKDPLRQAKTSIIVFTSLVCRAAMEGGLSPEIAYSLGDSYIQSVEDCRDSGELTAISYAMYRDFIYRVHQVRTGPGISHAVQKCCDYIQLSLNRKVRAADLAALVGYTEYYLTEKFKKETGVSVNAYIRSAKIERAKVLLETTDLPVNEIADRLAFNTPNYFIQTFRETAGMTPARYRDSCRNKDNNAGKKNDMMVTESDFWEADT